MAYFRSKNPFSKEFHVRFSFFTIRAQVGKSGGDDPQKALDLVLDLIEGSRQATNGQILWIKDGLQTPIASW